MMQLHRPTLVLLLAILFAVPAPVRSQAPSSEEEKKKQVEALQKQIVELQAKLGDLTKPQPGLPLEISNKFPWRCIGPANMGGRITALAVNEADPTMYWVATSSGGLLKTVNNGTTFEYQFDQEATVSIGDVAVAPSNPNIVWVGTGEANPRNSVSYGDGVYKSTDGGKTWKNMGLKKSFQIGKVLIHPKNPEIVYVGALGRLYGPSEERGIFKTEDGGKTWAKVLFVDDKTGCLDIVLDPHDDKTLIASMWERKRDEHDGFFGKPPVPDAYGPIVTHGPGGGIWKSTDAGKTWKKLNDPKLNNGLPTVKTGRIAFDYSRKTPGLIYAIIDTEKGGTGTLSKVFFGAVIDTEDGAKLSEVTDDSPASKAGLKSGDVVVMVDKAKIESSESFLDYFLAKAPGDKIEVTVKRDGKEVKATVTLGTRTDEPTPPTNPPLAGFTFAKDAKLIVQRVTKDGPAEKAGMLPNDEIVKIDGVDVKTVAEYQAAVGKRKPGDKSKFTVLRDKETKVLEVTLGAPGTGGPPRGQTNTRPFGLGLGGQQPNVQRRQGKDGFQTGGVFKSKDNGETWERVNSLNPRPMYFSVVKIDPTDDNTIYILGDVPTPLWKSSDGGKTFANMSTASGIHPDAHAFWIDPKDSRHMILGCDGGFYVSYDKGVKWDHLNTLALGQFYSVAVDNRRPYRVYGGLQDNGSWGGPSDTLKRVGQVNEDWVFIAGGDGFVCRVDPNDPDTVYAESQGGNISRRNFRTGEGGSIRPQRKDGDVPLRFNWNTPYILSNHNSHIFYSGAQFVFKSVKQGAEQKPISPDLTRSLAGSLTAIAESPKNPEVLWAGSDDGFLWITKDGGGKWENITANLQKAGLPGFRYISSIETSKEKQGRAYVAIDAHRSDDDKPYLFVTEDFGATWKPIANNLPAFGSTRVLREDIVNPNILYCGTEFGAFASIDRGTHWTKLGRGLPTVACHEFAQPTTANELVVGTHGRSIWIIDVNALRQMKPETFKEAVLFAPAPSTRWRIGANGESPYHSTDRKFVGTNPTRGATFDLYLAKPAKAVSLKVTDVTGKLVWEYKPPTGNQKPAGYRPITEAGLHRITWSLAGQAAGGGRPGGRPLQGGQVPPGAYKLVAIIDEKEYPQQLLIELDPNAPKDIVSTEGVLEQLEADRKARKKEGRLDD